MSLQNKFRSNVSNEYSRDLSLQDSGAVDHFTTRYLSVQAPSASGSATSLNSTNSSRPNNSGGMFKKASNFQINRSTFVDVAGSADLSLNTAGRSQATQVYVNAGKSDIKIDATVANDKANSILEKKRIPGAEFDSSDRYPPPKCYKSTRNKIREVIRKWLNDDNRESNMFWVIGAAGVGKSAVAQTVIEEWIKDGQPGASYFFSRPNHRDDPSTVVPTLVYRLIHQDSNYKDLIQQLFGEDPSLLEKDIQSQFNKLIAEPFRLLRADKRCNHPLLIVLDGLDECAGRENQRLFARIISDYAKSGSDSPLLWLVLSRPERLLKGMFEGTSISCRSELSADEEACRDVHEFLRDEFQVLQRRFAREGLIPSNSEWPTKDQLHHLGHAASGLFVIASTVLRFVEHGTRGTAVTRLQHCIDFLTKVSTPKQQDGTRTGRTKTQDETSPLVALDRLYHEILKDSSVDNQMMMNIMCLRILYPEHNLSVRLHSIILGLDRSDFVEALLEMQSVLLVPPSDHMEKYGILFHHASFADFLQDPCRSQEFHTLFNEACCNIAICCLRWYNPLIITRCPPGLGSTRSVGIPPLTWPPAPGDHSDSVDAIFSIVGRTVWTACCHVDVTIGSNVEGVLVELRRLSFCHLDLSARGRSQFVRFLSWLYKADTHRHILRTMPFSFRDLQLAFEIRFKLSLNADSLLAGQSRIEIISRHPRKKPSKKEQSSAFLLGVKRNACLVRVIPERIIGDNLNQPELLLKHVDTISRLYL